MANEGGIFDFGLNFDGSLANNHLNAPIIGIANSPGFDGYVMAGGDGGVFALGGANFYGSLGGQAIPSPISAIAAPPSENGYWLAAQNGKIYNFGAAPALPALSSCPRARTSWAWPRPKTGQGAWLTDQLGDVYAEGDALYVGGLGGVHLNKPIVGIAAAASGQGYVLVASDGGVFNYGTQGFFGSVPGSLKPGQSLVAPIVGHRGHPLGQRLLGGRVRRRRLQLRRRPVLGLDLHGHRQPSAQRAHRRDPAPGRAAVGVEVVRRARVNSRSVTRRATDVRGAPSRTMYRPRRGPHPYRHARVAQLRGRGRGEDVGLRRLVPDEQLDLHLRQRLPGRAHRARPELVQGCCSYGAHLVDKKDARRVEKAAATLTPEEWQNHGVKKNVIETNKHGETVTRLVDDACIFLNGPDFAGRRRLCLPHRRRPAGRQLHDAQARGVLAAAAAPRGPGGRRRGARHLGRSASGTGGTGARAAANSTGGAPSRPRRSSGKKPVYREMQAELTEMVGSKIYDRFVALVRERERLRTNGVAAPPPSRAAARERRLRAEKVAVAGA